MVWLLNSQGMKNSKSKESFCLSILTIYTNDWSTFWHVYCCHVYFYFARFLNMCKPRTTLYLICWADSPGLAFYGWGIVCLPSWLAMVNVGWLNSMRPEIFLQMKFIIFMVVSLNRLPFYLGSPLHVISSLFIHFCLFQNAILHKMLKLGFWYFNLIILRMQFSLVPTFISLVLVICLKWYLHLKLFHEFLTFIWFNVWR